MVTANRAGRVLTLAGARRVSDISPSKVLDALATLRDEGLGHETINHHVRAVKAFSRWLWKDGRAREHALAHLATSNPEADRRRRRRALTPEEAGRLVRAAERGPVVMGMTGPDRARCYRPGPRDRIPRGRVGEPDPRVVPARCRPAHGRLRGRLHEERPGAVQPIPASLSVAAPLAGHAARRAPVFDLPDRTAEMLRVDLDAAGIPYETPSGVFDFHAFRGVYISNLVASGASVKTCQVLARHSTPSLTIGIYAKASLHDIKGAVESLPDPTTAFEVRGLAATGTEGKPLPSATRNATLVLVDSTQGQESQEVKENPTGILSPQIETRNHSPQKDLRVTTPPATGRGDRRSITSSPRPGRRSERLARPFRTDQGRRPVWSVATYPSTSRPPSWRWSRPPEGGNDRRLDGDLRSVRRADRGSQDRAPRGDRPEPPATPTGTR